MATGSGKTIVMTMLITWQVLNKVTYPQDKRFSKYIFIVAPGLTVKSRLQVLIPTNDNNYYDEFNIVPAGMIEKLRQSKILIHNWHVLNWETEEKLEKKRSVDKRGVKSDEAYVREVLGEISRYKNILVINDEAHHAWRVPAESKVKGVKKEEIDEATIWVSGLDRIHNGRNILTCYDFSATPFAPSGKKSTEEALFGWIVSDFGLNDAIESGLVKTPRVVIRDDALPDTKTYKSKLYHIYEHVKDDLNRKTEEHEPLPDLVNNAYYLLGWDWRETLKEWRKTGHTIPPVMISVANRTETAARIKHTFDHNRILIEELCNSERTLHIDSKVLESAELEDEITSIPTGKKKLTKKEQAGMLRLQVDTVGKVGEPGENIQNVISVGMLSEGWDAKTVTHIMGLRAFSSQLLCEQVVGRGLRRTSYEVNPSTGLFDPEYVNIFGIPFTFLPHESEDGPPPPPPTPKTRIEPVDGKKAYELSWPNIIRIESVYKPKLTLDMGKVEPLAINAYETAQIAELAPVVDGKPNMKQISKIELEKLARKFRTQKIIFEVARDNYDFMCTTWKGNKDYLLTQLIRIIEQFIESDLIQINPPIFNQDNLRRRLLITLNLTKVVQHIKDAIHFENTQSLVPVFDNENPIRSTSNMRTWYTGKPCEFTERSHINFTVYDSTWEVNEAFIIDRHQNVEAWVKNDHLGFEILYLFNGVVKKYWPDFIIRLTNKKYLILEVKGQDTQKDKTKRKFLDQWVQGVNQHGGFGQWSWAVSKYPGDISNILQCHS